MQTIAEYETKARYPYSNIFYGELETSINQNPKKLPFMFDKKLLVKKTKTINFSSLGMSYSFANLCEETVLRH
jgi:hypothetical protein